MEARTMNKVTTRLRHEVKMRNVSVSRIEILSPNIRAITFKGESLSDFYSPSFEDHVKLIVETRDGAAVRRDYTPRKYRADTQELTLEIGIHDHGLGSDWARHARLGDAAVIAGPKGSLMIPKDYDWHLLVGDLTALPAIHRRLEELPSESKVIVRLLISEAADQRVIELGPSMELQWFTKPIELIRSVKGLKVPSGIGFAWCAGEAALMSEIKTILVDEKALAPDLMKIGVYWKSGDPGYHTNLVRPD